MIDSSVWSETFIVYFSDCRNCKVLCTTEICFICAGLPRCTVCKRHLPLGRFNGGDICKACQHKKGDVSHRTALNGLVREIDLPVDGTDRELKVFMQDNAEQILNILRGTLTSQT